MLLLTDWTGLQPTMQFCCLLCIHLHIYLHCCNHDKVVLKNSNPQLQTSTERVSKLPRQCYTLCTSSQRNVGMKLDRTRHLHDSITLKHRATHHLDQKTTHKENREHSSHLCIRKVKYAAASIPIRRLQPVCMPSSQAHMSNQYTNLHNHAQVPQQAPPV